ncbi:MAG TPA: MetQ/NlpA family ABC transporter substrate-binding protein, partial [Virgibacillus sp.]|nr:MetQ/NlpA family ABC transporter substrate-binding protein [Virgibacillus sp.]
EIEAAQIPKQLSELDLGVINGNFALENDLDPLEDSILSESSDTPFVNQLVVREENLDDPVLEKLKELYHSQEVVDFILDKYEGIILPGWDY